MSRKKTQEEYQQLLDKKYNGNIQCIGDYINMSTKTLHFCRKHNYEYSSKPNDILNSRTGCPLCGKELQKSKAEKTRSYTDEEYKKALFEKYHGNIENLEPYQSRSTSILHICHRHNYEYTSTPKSVLGAKYGCKYCMDEHRSEMFSFSLEKVNQKIHDLVGDEYEIVGNYENTNTKTTFKHNAQNGEVHYFDIIPRSFFDKGARCYCEKGLNRLIVGINDIATVRPDLVDLLYDKEDAYKYTATSKKKIKWVCPDCGEIIYAAVTDVTYNRLVCPRCSDGISYPNKFMFNSLLQIENELDFLDREYSPDWCKYDYNGTIRQGKYDIYFEINGKCYVVENDGGVGHGNAIINKKYNKEDTLMFDSIKDKLALEHGIEVIRIDCNYAYNDDRYEYILNNIMNSRLKDIIDLNKIDFDLSNKQSLSSLIVKASELWNQGFTAGYIKKELRVCESTVSSYLKTASKIGLCNDYTPKKSLERSRCKKVYCTTTKRLFDSMTQAADEYGTNRDGINKTCKGINRYSGIYEGQELHWISYDDYLESISSSEEGAFLLDRKGGVA